MEKLYGHLYGNSLFLAEQKGCRMRLRCSKDQLLIDKERCLAMGWIDYQKAYDMVQHSWIVETLETVKVADKVNSLLCGSMSDQKNVLTLNSEMLGELEIKSGIFQGDTLSPCSVLVLKQGVKVCCEGTVLPSGQVMGDIDKNGYTYK